MADLLTLFGPLYGFLAILLGLTVWGARRFSAIAATFDRTSPAPSPDNDLEYLVTSMSGQLQLLENRMDACMKAVAEGIDHVDRNEKRVRGILTGARNRFASAGYEDPGVEAEVESLPEVNEAPSQEEQLPPVPEDLELGSWGAVPGMRRS